MVVECISIIGVIGLVIFGFLRGGKTEYAVATSALVVVPLAHLLGELFLLQFESLFSLSPSVIIMWLDILGLAISCGMTVYFSTKIASLKLKRSFIIVFCGYSIILTCVFIYNVLPF